MAFSFYSSIRFVVLLFVFSGCKSEENLTLNIQREPNQGTGLFSSIQGYAVKLVFKILEVSDAFGCVLACIKEPSCQSVNFGTSGNPKHLCELSQGTYQSGVLGKEPRPGFIHYFAVKRGETCSKRTGLHCQLGTEWLRVGSAVCIGAKDDKFGRFTIPVACHVLNFKLVYVSGGGISWSNGNTKAYWGTTYRRDNKDLNLHITDADNNRISPPPDFPLDPSFNTLMIYQLPGVTNMDPDFTFPELSPPLAVAAGKELRIWVDQDLNNVYEGNNEGQTCADVWIKKY